MAGRKVRCSKCQAVAQGPAARELSEPGPAPVAKPWASLEGVLDRPPGPLPELLPPRARARRDQEDEPGKRRRSVDERDEEKPNDFALKMTLLGLGIVALVGIG